MFGRLIWPKTIYTIFGQVAYDERKRNIFKLITSLRDTCIMKKKETLRKKYFTSLSAAIENTVSGDIIKKQMSKCLTWLDSILYSVI